MHFHDLLNKVSREIKNSKNRVLWIFPQKGKNEVKKKKDEVKLTPKKMIWIVAFKKIFVFSD